MSIPRELPDDDARLLTIPQAAGYLSIGRTTMYDLIARGDIRPVLVASLTRVPVGELRSYVARQQARGRVTPLRRRGG